MTKEIFVQNLCVSGDTLEGEFGIISYHYPRSDTTELLYEASPEYVLRNATKIQVKVAYTIKPKSIRVYILFVKKYKEDNEMNYTLQISSKRLQLNESLKCKVENDQEPWHEIYKTEKNIKYYFNFDIKVVLNIVPCTPFASLYEDTKLLDFELKGENGSVRIHKLTLAPTSPFFKRMLSGEWKETSEGVLDVPETSLKTLQDLKDYIYLGKLPSRGVEELLMISMRYMMNGLEQKCVSKIIEGMTAKNAFELLEFSVNQNANKLRVAVLENMRYGAAGIYEIEDYFRKCNIVDEAQEDA